MKASNDTSDHIRLQQECGEEPVKTGPWIGMEKAGMWSPEDGSDGSRSVKGSHGAASTPLSKLINMSMARLETNTITRVWCTAHCYSPPRATQCQVKAGRYRVGFDSPYPAKNEDGAGAGNVVNWIRSSSTRGSLSGSDCAVERLRSTGVAEAGASGVEIAQRKCRQKGHSAATSGLDLQTRVGKKPRARWTSSWRDTEERLGPGISSRHMGAVEVEVKVAFPVGGSARHLGSSDSFGGHSQDLKLSQARHDEGGVEYALGGVGQKDKESCSWKNVVKEEGKGQNAVTQTRAVIAAPPLDPFVRNHLATTHLQFHNLLSSLVQRSTFNAQQHQSTQRIPNLALPNLLAKQEDSPTEKRMGGPR
ncbi:hypothetical protein B0H14DRAFT_2576338 [Mycena olivaceomarginata]|nr:hypothetical protein B0H14DRAFT_2576338 [Mycena olivaceomarginata]